MALQVLLAMQVPHALRVLLDHKVWLVKQLVQEARARLGLLVLLAHLRTLRKHQCQQVCQMVQYG